MLPCPLHGTWWDLMGQSDWPVFFRSSSVLPLFFRSSSVVLPFFRSSSRCRHRPPTGPSIVERKGGGRRAVFWRGGNQSVFGIGGWTVVESLSHLPGRRVGSGRATSVLVQVNILFFHLGNILIFGKQFFFYFLFFFLEKLNSWQHFILFFFFSGPRIPRTVWAF